MQKQFTQANGSTAKEVNKQTIARIFSIPKSAVSYLTANTPIDNYTVLYDQATQTCWYTDTATGTPTNWTVSGLSMNLVTSTGTYTLIAAQLISKRVLSSTAGATLIGLEQGATLNKYIDYVSAEAEGVIFQTVDSIKAGTATDMSDLLQSAINKAKSRRVPLYIGRAPVIGPSANYFIYLEKTVDMSGIVETLGALPIAVMGSTFKATFFTADTPARGVVLKNMNATYDSSTGKQYFGTSSGYQTLGSIQLSCLDDAIDPSILGYIHTGAYTRFTGDVWGRKFGTALRFANTYDCSFNGHVAVVDSGTIDYYGLEVGSYPAYDKADESNALTFTNMLLHTNRYRDASIVGSKINLARVHCEATTIGDLTNLTPNSVDKLSPSGFNSFLFASTGGTAGNVDIAPNNNSTNIGTYLFNMLGTDIGQIYGSAKSHIAVSDIYYLGRNGHVSSIYTFGDVTIGGGGTTTVNKIKCTGDLNPSNVGGMISIAEVGGNITTNSCRILKAVVTGTYSQNQYGTLEGGTVTGMVNLLNSSTIKNVTMNGGFTSASNGMLIDCTLNGAISITGAPTLERCTVGSGFTLSRGTYKDCGFVGIVKASSTSSVAGTLRNCSLGAGFDFSGNASMSVRMLGCSIGAASTIANASGYLIMDRNCIGVGTATSLTGWAKPTVTSPGYGSETINPYSGTGWRLCWTGSAAQWLPVTAYDITSTSSTTTTT